MAMLIPHTIIMSRLFHHSYLAALTFTVIDLVTPSGKSSLACMKQTATSFNAESAIFALESLIGGLVETC